MTVEHNSVVRTAKEEGRLVPEPRVLPGAPAPPVPGFPGGAGGGAGDRGRASGAAGRTCLHRPGARRLGLVRRRAGPLRTATEGGRAERGAGRVQGAMRPGEERPLEGGAGAGVSALELLKLRAAERIDEAAERLWAVSRAIWSKPELAYEEHHAHDVLTRFLESEPPAASWAVQPHYHLATAFRAEWGPPGGRAAPRPLQLGFLCEYDALPDIGHACGHNLIAEVGAAAALGVKGALEGLSGRPPPVKVRWGPGAGFHHLPRPGPTWERQDPELPDLFRPLPAWGRGRCRAGTRCPGLAWARRQSPGLMSCRPSDILQTCVFCSYKQLSGLSHRKERRSLFSLMPYFWKQATAVCLTSLCNLWRK